MESNSVSCETVFHIMQRRGFAAIYHFYLTSMTCVVALCNIAYSLLYATRLPGMACKSGLIFLPSMSEQVSTTEKTAPVKLRPAHRQHLLCYPVLSSMSRPLCRRLEHPP